LDDAKISGNLRFHHVNRYERIEAL
jgi:hypothetical protein